MGIGGINAANDMMMAMMQTLMQGMQENAAMAQKMVAMNVENHSIGTTMATAQNIIDVYA